MIKDNLILLTIFNSYIFETKLVNNKNNSKKLHFYLEKVEKQFKKMIKNTLKLNEDHLLISKVILITVIIRS